MPLVLNGGLKKTPKELVPKGKVQREKTTTSSDFLYPEAARKPGFRPDQSKIRRHLHWSKGVLFYS
jgi:hypothetical protein